MSRAKAQSFFTAFPLMMEDSRLRQLLGQEARRARLGLDMTQADVAESAGMSTEVYGRVERGHMMPSVPTLRRLCMTLGTSANGMLALEPSEALAWARSLGSEDPPALRRLVRNLRRLGTPELRALNMVAVMMLDESENPRSKRAAKKKVGGATAGPKKPEKKPESSKD